MFEVHQDVADPRQIFIIEQWPSRDHHFRMLSEVMARPTFADLRGMLAADLQFTYCATR
jgi:quinol monooxygenase YgiN